MQYKPRVDHGAGNGESEMSKFKVGDVIESVSDFCPMSGLSSGDVRIVTDCKNGSVYFNDSDGIQRYRPQIGYKLIHRPEQTPPATITHEGYTYNRGERVVPEWVKDGAWAIYLVNNDLTKISVKGDQIWTTLNGGKTHLWAGNSMMEHFRPHTPEDYKWGDWAMYEGKKVFVMSYLGSDGVEISRPNIYKKALDGWTIVQPSDLTPTFAP